MLTTTRRPVPARPQTGYTVRTPVVLRVLGYSFRFYEADLNERPHVHVTKAGREAKRWIDPFAVARRGRFRPNELGDIRRIVVANREFLVEA